MMTVTATTEVIQHGGTPDPEGNTLSPVRPDEKTWGWFAIFNRAPSRARPVRTARGPGV